MNTEEIDYVRSQSGWSDVILKNINSIDEAKIYLKAGLKEAMVGGRHALIRSDIDWSAFNCRKEWLKTKLSDWDRWKDYNNADLIGEGIRQGTPMAILMNSIISVSARILHSRNCPGLSIWATVTTPFCIGWENIQS